MDCNLFVLLSNYLHQRFRNITNPTSKESSWLLENKKFSVLFGIAETKWRELSMFDELDM